MRNRKTFRPACSEIETLEIRNLMDATPFTAPDQVAPVPVAPVQVFSVVVSDQSSTTPNNNLSYWVVTNGTGTDSQVAFINVIVTITDKSGAIPYQVQQTVTTIPVSPSGSSFSNGAIDMSNFPFGNYDVDVKAYDLTNPTQNSQDASTNYNIPATTAPQTSTPFFVVSSDSPTTYASIL